MKPDRWQQIEQVCHAALECQAGERAGFLDEVCGDDAELRREVESLLAGQSDARGFLETPAAAAAGPAPSDPPVPIRHEAGDVRTDHGLAPDSSGGGQTDDELAGAVLSTGTRLGPYEIIRLVGAGGMGEVYQARDTRLGRTVAIKLLPPGLASDPERRRRFESEARAVSALNHSNICTLHDVGSQHGLDFLVMEFLEGRTLAERLTDGPLPLGQALEYGAQVADGLDAAHRRGIVHRDLKPANVMITKAGAKLLDFGLAKLRRTGELAGRSGPAATSSASHTKPGMVLGTVPYMAPEQLAGREADARADIWGLGCVLYEMLAGRRAFSGESTADLVAAIMNEQTPVLTLPPAVPPLVDHIIRTCLRKEPDERWQSVADISRGLRWVGEQQRRTDTTASGRETNALGAGVVRSRVPRVAAWVAAGILLAAAVATVTWFLARGYGARAVPVQRVLIDARPADGIRGTDKAERTLGLNRPSRTAVALSPDGRTLVFAGIAGKRQQLYRRELSEDAAAPIEGTEGGENPFFSPDGTWIGFWARGALWKMRLEGGVPTQLCPARDIVGASWSSRDVIAFASAGIHTVPAAGGASSVLAEPDVAHGEMDLRFPSFLPDGKTLLVTVVRDSIDLRNSSTVAVSLSGGARRPLVEGAVDARYLPTGHLVYARLGQLEAVPFDASRLSVAGPAVDLVADLMQAANAGSDVLDSGAGQFTVSATGTLVYLPGGVVPDRPTSLAWVDRRGSVLETLPLAPAPYYRPRLSPDGQRILYASGGLRPALWCYDIPRRTATFVPTREGNPLFPVWVPDGRHAIFSAPGGGFSRLSSVPVDASEPSTRLKGEVPTTAQEIPGSWTPDGRVLLYTRLDEQGPAIWELRIEDDTPKRTELLPPEGERAARRVLYLMPALAPDGRWLAYVSSESGGYEVYVERFPEMTDRRQISRGGGHAPIWKRDGRELFYITTDEPRRMMAIEVGLNAQSAAGEPRTLFEVPAELQTAIGPVPPYDASLDGQRFIFARRGSGSVPAPPSEMHVVFNWLEELKQKVPVR